ncbi:hypothetical protein SRHO_G00261740 [Serrasalmus rhombeus]
MTVCELYDILSTLRTELRQRQADSFFGVETSALQQFPDCEATAIKQDFSNFYRTSLSYLEKWYDFSDSNFHKHVAVLGLKSEFTFSHLCDVVEILQMRDKLNMDELYEEYSVTLQCQQESKERRGVSLTALKKALAAGGYDMEKNNNSRVKSLVTKGTLVQTKGTGASGSFKLKKKQAEAKKKPAKKSQEGSAEEACGRQESGQVSQES